MEMPLESLRIEGRVINRSIDLLNMPADRKITGDKFTITLPKDWRDSHGLSPGQSLTPFYGEGTPLVFIPKELELSEAEVKIIEVLTKYRTSIEAKEFGDKIAKVIDTAINEAIAELSQGIMS